MDHQVGASGQFPRLR